MVTQAPKHAPAVTVIAVCYNHARFVIECLESIRRQTFTDFELIVIDDKSSDSSPQLIAGWLKDHFPTATFIAHQVNVGLCKTLNEALALATGEYIGLIATDDAWMPDKLMRQVARLRELSPTVALVFSDAEQMDEQGVTLPKTFIEAHRPAGVDFPATQMFSALADGNFIPAMATLLRRQALVDVGGYDESLSYEDYDMWLRLADRFTFDFLPGTVARYRIVATSMVRTLFVNPNSRHSFSIYLIHRKWIATGKLSKAQRKQWGAKIAAAAYALYCAGDSRAARCLRFAVTVAPTARLLLLAVSSSLGLSRKRAKQLAVLVSFGQLAGGVQE
jgi:glycosyltransferase involved in cell wall biosynthesis